MDLGLDGKVAVVTGASRGIGLAIAEALAAEGVRVVAGARSAGPPVPGVEWVAVDLAQAGGPERLVEAAGGVDVLVNNVGGAGSETGGPLDPTDAAWESALDLNLMSAVRATRAAVPSMLDRGGGAVVSVSSINAFMPFWKVAPYSAAKAALVTFTKNVALAYADRGIRANVVSPGVTATRPRDEAMLEAIPMRRFLEPAEVAAVVVLVASGKASGMTGHDVVVDAGLTPTT